MLLVIGYIIVLGSVLGGFVLAGGNPLVLLHVSEFVVIGGVALGLLIIASSKDVLLKILSDIKGCLKGGAATKDDFLDVMKLLYELFMTSRRGGLIALDEHISDPNNSNIFVKYPKLLAQKEIIEFLVNAFRPVIDGKVKPELLSHMLEEEIDCKEEEAEQSTSILNLVGDSLPGIGIVAAVLGIINTMSAIAEGPGKVGEKVAAALTGTFLGVLSAYGFVNPLAKRVSNDHRLHFLYLRVMSKAISEFSKGVAPLMALEMARRQLDKSIQPKADELEEILKSSIKTK